MTDPLPSKPETAQALLPCPFCGEQPRSQWHPAPPPDDDCGYWGVECCAVAVHEDTERGAAAIWNTRCPPAQQVPEAEFKAKAALSYLIDAVEYSDSYGVHGSDFMCCHLCHGGGAPGVKLVHEDTCPVKRCEAVADEYWEEENERQKETKELRAALATATAPSPQVQPVAWMHVWSGSGEKSFTETEQHFTAAETTPLYAALPPQGRETPDGLANLNAILDDQPFANSALSVIEIQTILKNEGGFMPDEAVLWFRAARGTLGSASPQKVNEG